YYYESTITADLLNTASTTANPTDSGGVDIPGLTDPTDNDTAEVALFAPAITIAKTVYLGTDSGASCPGGELASGVSGTAVTYCFVVTNTGDTYLDTVTISDTDLGITHTDMTLLSGSTPLAPLATLVYYYESTITADLLNTASTTANPTDSGGVDIPGLTDPTDNDTAEIALFAPAILLNKTVYAGHDSGASCPGVEIVNGALGANITYCFTVTNTGDTYLDTVTISDSDLGITHTDMTLLSGSTPLAPAASLVYYYETTITGALINTASVSANPTDSGGVDIPGLTNPSDDDTAQITESGQVMIYKNFLTSNLPNSPSREVAIGEILTYRVRVDFSESSAEYIGVTVTDQLDSGLAFLDCVSVTATNGLYYGLNQTDFSYLCQPDPITPNTGNPAITPLPGSGDNAGRNITWEVGDVWSSGGINTLTFTYRVVVLNIQGNVSGIKLNNNAIEDFSGTQAKAAQVTIVEPALKIIKTADVEKVKPGQIFTFYIELKHTPKSEIDAFDVIMSDTIPDDLIYVGNLRHVSGQAPTLLDDTQNPFIKVVWDEFLDNGTSSVVAFDVKVGLVPPGTSIVNTAYAEWSSLPGDISTPQSPYNNRSVERGYDPPSSVDFYGGISDSEVVPVPGPTGGGEEEGSQVSLPATGFPPGETTDVSDIPENNAYMALAQPGIILEIPSQGIMAEIVGIPLNVSGWDVSWLSQQLGYLEGTTYPTLEGNTAITGHVVLPSGIPGPFAHLSGLGWGDNFILHANGQKYIYQVRSVDEVYPSNLSILDYKPGYWITLITCSSYNEAAEVYNTRTAVQAVLISIEPGDQ
ncbi:MAG: sortase, partial [Anaerolineae bacterium]|nr:sortase [Anaerolineae bacterium]